MARFHESQARPRESWFYLTSYIFFFFKEIENIFSFSLWLLTVHTQLQKHYIHHPQRHEPNVTLSVSQRFCKTKVTVIKWLYLRDQDPYSADIIVPQEIGVLRAQICPESSEESVPKIWCQWREFDHFHCRIYHSTSWNQRPFKCRTKEPIWATSVLSDSSVSMGSFPARHSREK